MAFGDNELLFRINTSGKGLVLEKQLDGYSPEQEIFSILEIVRKEFYAMCGFESQFKNIEIAGATTEEKAKSIKSSAKKLNQQIQPNPNGLGTEFLKSALPHWIASWTLKNLAEPKYFSEMAIEKRIDLIYKYNEKIIIKKLAIDGKTTIYQTLFQFSSLTHSLVGILQQSNNKEIKQRLAEVNEFKKQKLYPYPTLELFSVLELPDDEKKRFSKIIKKMQGKK